jgi:hypothetical protein
METLKQDWLTPPGIVLLCGGVVVTLSMDLRHSFGLFLQPMSMDLGGGREVFSVDRATPAHGRGHRYPHQGGNSRRKPCHFLKSAHQTKNHAPLENPHRPDGG